MAASETFPPGGQGWLCIVRKNAKAQGMKFQLEDDGYNNLLLGSLEMFLFKREKKKTTQGEESKRRTVKAWLYKTYVASLANFPLLGPSAHLFKVLATFKLGSWSIQYLLHVP